MTWYTLFHQDTGALIASTPRPTTPTETIGVITTDGEPDLGAVTWDPVSRSWMALPVTGRLVVSRREFRRRFSWAERVAIRVAMRTHADLTVRASLEEVDVELSDSTAIELDHPDTAAVLQMLVSLALLAPERPAEILAAAPV